jgi:PAS domain S-box-containing protein
MTIITPFITNAALLLALSMLSGHFRYLWLMRFHQKDWVIGILYGFFAILVMTAPFTLVEGAIFDSRSIILGLAGLFEPPIVTLIAALIASVFRYFLGGIGVFTGIGSIVISSAIGLVFSRVAKNKKCQISFLNLLILGLIIHVILVIWFFTFPRSIAIEILNTVAAPYIAIFSFTTMLIGLFMHGQQQRLKTEQSLAESEQKYRQLVETLQEGIWAVDQDQITSFVNPSMAAMLGFSEGEMIGKHFKDFVDNKEHHRYEELFQRRSQGLKDRYETVLIHKNGSRVFVIVEAAPIVDRNGNFAGSLAGIQDITDRKRAEGELEKYSKNLEEMVDERTRELKDAQNQLIAAEKLTTLGEMAASVGHELRNPLSVIRNAAYLLKSFSRGDTKIEEYVNLIDTESRNASQIVTDLLEYSRIKPMKSDMVELRDLVGQVLQKIQIPANIQQEINVPQDLPKALGNAQQISQILLNLIKNALEAMPEGGKLSVNALRKEKKIILGVIDTGQGIPREHMKKLFEPLFTTKARGVGLGLAISKRLADLNQAEITVKSKVGEGSVFSLELKAA